jgi:cytochrome P450
LRLPRDRAVDTAIAELRVWLDGLVREARARFAHAPEGASLPADRTPAHFLEAMVAARDEHGQPFSDQVIFGNLMTMLLAGEDTTAYTLAWAVHHLCDQPDAVAALQSELDALGSDGPVPAELDAAQALTYAGAVANETMRLRPVAPLLIFETLVPTALGDIDLPEGAILIVLTRPANLTPERFNEPERFSPQRWLAAAAGAGSNARAQSPRVHDPSAHIPFGSGPRICPGRSLALLEMKVALAALYGRFDVSRAPSSPTVSERFSFTMCPEGVSVLLRRRAQRA